MLSEASFTNAAMSLIKPESAVISTNNGVPGIMPNNFYWLANGHEKAVLACRFNNSGNVVVSAGLDPHLTIWSLDTGESYAVKDCHKNGSPITTLELFDEETKIITGSSDTTLSILDFETGMKLKSLPGHSSIINQVKPLSNTTIASVGDDGMLKVWDVRTRKAVWSATTEFPLFTLATTGEKHMVYTSGLEPVIRIWDLRSSQKDDTLSIETPHTDSILSLDLTNRSKICSLGFDNTLHFYDGNIHSVKDSRVLSNSIKLSSTNDDKFLTRCKLIQDGRYVLAHGCMYDVVTRTLLSEDQQQYHVGQVIDMDYNESTNRIVSSSVDGSLLIKGL